MQSGFTHSIVYSATRSGHSHAGTELASINIALAAGIFTGEAAQNPGGGFDHDWENFGL